MTTPRLSCCITFDFDAMSSWIGTVLLATTMLAPLSANAAEDEDRRDIVVTARRVDERANDVPLHVAVVPETDVGAGAVVDDNVEVPAVDVVLADELG